MARRETENELKARQYKPVRQRAVGKPNVPSKLCVHCDAIKPLNEFYGNMEWSTQSYHDAWCKECARKCTTIEAVREYCHMNNRHWSDVYWDAAGEKAKYVLANDAEYLSDKVSAKRKREIRDACIARQWFGMMNHKAYYQYEEHVGSDGVFSPGLTDQAIEDSKQGILLAPEIGMTDQKKYSKVWRGYYMQSEIEALDEIYEKLEEDFVLDNENMRDYARKVAKASFDADRAGDRYRSGQITLKEYRDAMDMFDNLSKSSNFAACRRKPGESSGLGNLGEIILRVELSGALNENPYNFPEDQIDQIIHDFEHTLVAVGARGDLD